MDDTTALVRLGVLRRTEDSWGVTLAGLLTLGQWPQQYLPQLCVTFIAVPAASKDAVPAGAPRFTDNATVRGPLPQMIEQTVQVILRNTRTAGYVHGLGREDVEDYPVEALREAVTNALAHAAYVLNDDHQRAPAGHPPAHPVAGRGDTGRQRYDRSAQIMALLADGRTLTASEIRTATGLGPAMTNRYLARLVEAGRLRATAPPRSPGRAFRASPS